MKEVNIDFGFKAGKGGEEEEGAFLKWRIKRIGVLASPFIATH